jgi:hypothetical protein
MVTMISNAYLLLLFGKPVRELLLESTRRRSRRAGSALAAMPHAVNVGEVVTVMVVWRR